LLLDVKKNSILLYITAKIIGLDLLKIETSLLHVRHGKQWMIKIRIRTERTIEIMCVFSRNKIIR
jgi:hypothetical protein